MKSKYREIDISKIRTIPFEDRHSKVEIDSFAGTFEAGGSFSQFLNSLPGYLKSLDFREFVGHIVDGHRKGSPFIWMMGAHVVKCGLAPVIVDLIKRGIISALAVNGAVIIHDMESAYWGRTSEDVEINLNDGTFGMSKETADLVNDTLSLKKDTDLGLGEVIGKRICSEKPSYKEFSLLASAYEHDVPVTVHVAIGTDIVHQHPNADGAAIGVRSMRDFRILADIITRLDPGGVVVNAGSNVVLPEVFLKALTIARNVGNTVIDFYTANFDMLKHYRPSVNVVRRPTAMGGKGYDFTGHHEIMIPLLAAAIVEEIGKPS